MQGADVRARFTWEDKITVETECVYKNEELFGTTIPDLGAECPEGEHLVNVEITLNGQ